MRFRKNREKLFPTEPMPSFFKVLWQGADKKRLAVWSFWIILLIISVLFSIWIFLAAPTVTWVGKYQNHLRLCTAVVALVSVVMAWRTSKCILPPEVRRELGRIAVEKLKRMISPVVRAVARVLDRLGIDITGHRRVRGKDEKRFVFGEADARKKKKRLRHTAKWEDMPDNASRVRFIFTDHMIHCIREGYRMRRNATPAEMAKELAFEQEEKDLFSAYEVARYAGDEANEIITDDMVEAFRMAEKRKK